MPGLKGADRRNLSGSDLDVYLSGDWDRVWSEVLPYVPVERRRLFSERNDLLAWVIRMRFTFSGRPPYAVIWSRMAPALPGILVSMMVSPSGSRMT